MSKETAKAITCTEVDIQNVSDVYFWIQGQTSGGKDSIFKPNHADSLYRAMQIMKQVKR